VRPRWLLDRRSFLFGAGGSLIALPLLEAMFPTEKALAQGPTAADQARYVFVFFPNGSVGTEMSPRPGAAWSPILTPLEAHRSDLLFVEGLHNRQNSSWKWYDAKLGTGTGHEVGAPCFLTCARLPEPGQTRLSISIDQLIGQQLKQQRKSRLASLVMADGKNASGIAQGGVNAAFHSLMSWKSDKLNDYEAPLSRPQLVFEQIFAGFDPTGVPGQLTALQLRKKSILDTVKEQEAAMKGRLGVADQARLDQFFSNLREVETKVSALPPPTILCAKPSAPADVTAKNFPEFTRTMLDLVVLGLQCQVTPCISYQLSRGNGGVQNATYVGLTEDQHSISHHAGNAVQKDKLRKINTWFNEQLAYFVGRLKAIDELGQPLLRNVVTVFGSEVADGDAHNGFDLPIVLAGGQNLGIETGGIADFGLGKAGTGSIETDHTRAPPLANLFLTLAGLAGAPAQKFGNSTGKLELRPNV